MSMTKFMLLMVFVLGLGMLIGCSGETKNIAPDEMSEAEEGNGLTSQDYRSIANRMARSLISIAPIQDATNPPTIAFLSVENHTDDPYLDGDAFLNKMRTELMKHAEGRIIFLDRSKIEDIRKENRDKERGKVTAGSQDNICGADYFLTGTIESIEKAAGGHYTGYYRYSFRLTNASTSAIMWEDDYEIKKVSKMGSMYR